MRYASSRLITFQRLLFSFFLVMLLTGWIVPADPLYGAETGPG